MSDQLMENNAGFQPGPISPVCTSEQVYTVKPGDTMFFIAKRNNISLQELINANPQIADPNTIYPGQVLCIPIAPMTPNCAGNQTYRVVSGDTMFEIARRFGITLDALIAANPQIPDPNLIFPGQEICIPGSLMTPMPAPIQMPMPTPAPMPPMPAPIQMPMPLPAPMPLMPPMPAPCFNGALYTVQSGDTLFEIARANNILLTTLIAANPQIPDPNLIFPGQVICIPGPVLEVPAVPRPTCPIMMPLPVQQPLPMPAPRPVAPIERPMPLPIIPSPMPCPAAPAPMPLPMPCPAAPAPMPVPMPCPASCPMPFYMVLPWDECPHQFYRKKKHGRRKRQCR
ncbi:MAG TPA: hypothetical protein DDW50_11955 [Firmicutes bacterium]|nr:hypothetical protein [Bacillota bacterium]